MTTTPPPGSSKTDTDLTGLASALDESALQHNFSGVVSIDVDGSPVLSRGYGLAERVLRIQNRPETRFGVASVSKAFTALAVMSLVEDGTLSRNSRVRPMLGLDLCEVHDDVTLEHLLGHTSGIGDYLDESADWEVTDYVLPVPTHTLAETEGFLPCWPAAGRSPRPGSGSPTTTAATSCWPWRPSAPAAGDSTSWSPSVSSRPPGWAPPGTRGWTSPGRHRHRLPARDSVRTNVLHLPVRGNGDGGAVTTADDLSRFWRAFADGKIVSADTVEQMTRPRTSTRTRGCATGWASGWTRTAPAGCWRATTPASRCAPASTRHPDHRHHRLQRLRGRLAGHQRYVDWLGTARATAATGTSTGAHPRPASRRGPVHQ